MRTAAAHVDCGAGPLSVTLPLAVSPRGGRACTRPAPHCSGLHSARGSREAVADAEPQEVDEEGGRHHHGAADAYQHLPATAVADLTAVAAAPIAHAARAQQQLGSQQPRSGHAARRGARRETADEEEPMHGCEQRAVAHARGTARGRSAGASAGEERTRACESEGRLGGTIRIVRIVTRVRAKQRLFKPSLSRRATGGPACARVASQDSPLLAWLLLSSRRAARASRS
jgi:hypothetical protein